MTMYLKHTAMLMLLLLCTDCAGDSEQRTHLDSGQDGLLADMQPHEAFTPISDSDLRVADSEPDSTVVHDLAIPDVFNPKQDSQPPDLSPVVDQSVDSLQPDSQQPDSVQPDSLQPDMTPWPDLFMPPDQFVPDIYKPICGNGKCEPGEVCFNCPADCVCPTKCMNGIKEGTEQCDIKDFGGDTCKNYKPFNGGTLGCQYCKLTFGGCWACGDGKLQGSETCEMSGPTYLFKERKNDCKAWGYSSGLLGCDTSQCNITFSGCS